jgi:type I restriction enzyme S subunit
VSDWATIKLGEVAQFINGDRGRNYPSEGDFVAKGIAFINAGHLKRGTVDFSNMNYINEGRFRALRSGKTRENDILYCLRGSLGKTAIVQNTDDAAIASSLLIIRPSSACDVRYLYHFLVSPLARQEMNRFVNGSSQPNLSADSVKNYRVPFPPLPEQRRIAAILDKANALQAKRRAASEQLKSLTQALFFEMFGDPQTNPKAWDVDKLSDVATFENGDRSGNYPSGNDIKSEGVLFLSTANIIDNKLDLTRAHFISDDKFSSLSRGKAKPQDLIITLRGTLGSCCIFRCNHERAFINAQMMIIRPTHRILSEYLHALLTSHRMNALFQRIGTGVAVSQLTARQLAAIVIPCPPIPLQRAFAERVDSVEGHIRLNMEAVTTHENLFVSLQHRAFTGEL